jgi:hypothetical protein
LLRSRSREQPVLLKVEGMSGKVMARCPTIYPTE